MKSLPFKLSVLLVLGINAVYAQTTVSPLTIGDKAMGIKFNKILNHPSASATLNTYKNKIVILDFWATWCAPCVQGMPRLDTLQRKYKNDIVVLPVTEEKESVVQAFIKRNPKLKLPSVVDGKYLQSYFPFRILPHSVIIDKNRKVVAITASENITGGVIDSILAGQQIHLPLKKDVMNFYSNQPLMTKGNDEMNAQLLFRTLIVPAMPDLESGCSTTFIDRKEVGFDMYNAPIPHLFLYALDRPWQYSLSRIIFENVRDSTRYRSDNKWDYISAATEWARRNSYSFDIIAPQLSKEEQLKVMFQTLNTYFKGSDGLEVSLVKRKVPVGVLKKQDSMTPAPSGSTEALSFSMIGSTVSEFHHIETSELAFILETCLATPVVDSTGLGYPIDLVIEDSLLNYAKRNPLPLHKFLNKLGFKLERGWAEMEMVLFKEEH